MVSLDKNDVTETSETVSTDTQYSTRIRIHKFWAKAAIACAEAAVAIAAIMGAVYLIANGHEVGWGWLLLLAFLAAVG